MKYRYTVTVDGADTDDFWYPEEAEDVVDMLQDEDPVRSYGIRFDVIDDDF